LSVAPDASFEVVRDEGYKRVSQGDKLTLTTPKLAHTCITATYAIVVGIKSNGFIVCEKVPKNLGRPRGCSKFFQGF
jgi:hypothetical protein